MKIINALLSLISILFFIDHATMMTLLMLGVIPYNKGLLISGYILAIWLIFHAAFSVFYLIKSKQGKIKIEKEYPKANLKSILQRMTGIIMAVLIIFHIFKIITPVSASGFFESPTFIGALCMILIVLLIHAHVIISIPKLFVTLGISHKKCGRIIAPIISVIVSLPAFLGVVSVIIYLFNGGY